MPKEKVSIVIWTTSRCNLECRYCYAEATKSGEDMKFERAKQTLDYFSDASMKIQFAGGEPLLNYPLIVQIVDYAKSQNYDADFRLQTNATLMTAEIAKGMQEMKIAVGVSMDGPPEINEALRGKTRETVEGIQILGEFGIGTNLNAVVTGENVESLEDLVKFAFYLGNVSGIGLDLMREAGRSTKTKIARPTARQLATALENMKKKTEVLYTLSGRRIKIREIEEARLRLKQRACSKDYCYASCGRSYVVLPNGDVYPCGSLLSKPEYFMGNVMQANLKSRSVIPIRRDDCSHCIYLLHCPGGCPSRMIVNPSTEPGPSLDCVLKKTAFNLVCNDGPA